MSSEDLEYVIKYQLTDVEKSFLRIHLQNTSLLLLNHTVKTDVAYLRQFYELMNDEQRVRMCWILVNQFNIKNWNNI